MRCSILNQLIAIQLLLQKATAADRTTGQQEASLQYTNIVKKFGSPEALERQLKAVGMTMDELRAKATQEAVAKAALRRELNVSVTRRRHQGVLHQSRGGFRGAGNRRTSATFC